MCIRKKFTKQLGQCILLSVVFTSFSHFVFCRLYPSPKITIVALLYISILSVTKLPAHTPSRKKSTSSRVQAGGFKQMSSILADHSAFVYEPKCGGGNIGVSGSQPIVQVCTGAQINFGDLTPWFQQYLQSTEHRPC